MKDTSDACRVARRRSFRRRIQHRALVIVVAALLGGAVVPVVRSGEPAESPSFLNDVMPILSKAGCNMGTCHGNQNGKGGFKLSLRGADPHRDHLTIARGQNGRRIDRLQPEKRLLLLKPTVQMAHQGGRRFRLNSLDYDALLRWIADGAQPPQESTPRLIQLTVTPSERVLVEPEETVQLSVQAEFSDGSRRDVTRLAVYETSNLRSQVERGGLVRRMSTGETTVLVRFLQRQVPVRLAFVPARRNFQWRNPPAAGYIDRHVFEKLKTLRMNPSTLSSDHVFVRRAHLDALGIPPTAAEAKAFVADKRADKRARLIDSLLVRPEFAQFWALKWSDILRNEEKVLDTKGVTVFHGWLRDSFAVGMPLDRFAAELVAARGSTYKNPPANYWRAHREPLVRAETTAQVFLGVRLQCAKCHNHPFDRWTQDDYYSWATLFARIDYKIVENKRRDKNDKHEFVGEQIVLVKDKGEVKNARTGENALPRFLGAKDAKGHDKEDRLKSVARWITTENDMFARAQANRIWFHLMGRGIVEPIDDFRATNPPSHPELLDELAGDLARCGFDLRHLVRTIMNSRTYQLSSAPNDTNAGDEENFSRAAVVRLTAEQLLDAQCQALGVVARFNGYPEGTRAGQIAGVLRVRLRDQRPSDGDRFLRTFGKPPRLLACECERSTDTTLAHALALIGGEGLHRRLTHEDNRLRRLADSRQDDRAIVSQLYWHALSRPPTADELAASIESLHGSDDRQAALEDIAWAALNSKEFVFRH